MRYQEFLKSLEKKQVANLYHFTGEENFLKGEAIKKLIEILIPKGQESFNFDTVYASQTKLDQILNLTQTFPVGSSKRLVIVYEVERLFPVEKEFLLDHLKSLPDSTCLVLVSGKLDKRTTFYKTIKERIKNTLEFTPLKEEQLSSWISNRARSFQKNIDKQAIKLLVTWVGNGLFELANQIQKLVLYVGDKKDIDKADVENVVGVTKAHKSWDLGHRVGERDLAGALEMLKSLLLYGEKPLSILFWLTDHWIKLVKAKNFDPRKMGMPLASYLKTWPELTEKFDKQKVNFTEEKLEEGLYLLHQADVDLKTSRMPAPILLELLIYKLCDL
jgi:DNA polymerase-3 subunit delta